jgi:hypothetical protein
MPELEPSDLWLNPEPVCPHCGGKYSDAWEINFSGDMEGTTEITCGHCDEDFSVTRNVEVTYSTGKIKPKG